MFQPSPMYGAGDAAAGPLIRRSGPSTTVSVTVKKPMPAYNTSTVTNVTNVSVTAGVKTPTNVTSVASVASVAPVSGGSSPIRRAAGTGASAPAATLISVPAAAGDAAGTGRVIRQVGTPVAAKTRLASASARLAAAGASAQLRAVSLEYSHSDLTTATSNWSASKRLGSGKHGAVYKAELKDGSHVAVKAIDLAAVTRAGDSPQDAGFDEEVIMLSKFRHPNLVTLLGWGSHQDFRYLVYELLSGGDLFRRLHKSRSSSNPKPFPWHERISVCLDAASGLSHLHNSNPKAFHRDIKSANILLDRHGTAKLADFGLSCCSSYAGADHVDVRFASGTPGYRCPVYERTGRVSEASEAYSFCMVMLEVLLGLDPSATNSKAPSGLSFPIQEAVSPGKPGAEERCLQALDKTAGWPLELAQEMARLAIRGVNAVDEKQRPSSVEIVKTLRSLHERFPSNGTYDTKVQLAQAHVANEGRPVEVKHRATQPSVQKIQTRSVMTPSSVQASTPLKREELQESRVDVNQVNQVNQMSSASPKSATSPFVLEVTLATGSFLELTEEQRYLSLNAIKMEGGNFIAAVGRGQQPELFEAWLPDARIRTCVSRNAFEVAWREDSIWLTAQGSGPVSLDGKQVTPKTAYSLRHGADIGLLYGKQVLMKFRFHEKVKLQGQVVRSYTGSLVPPTPVMGHRALPSSPCGSYSARSARHRERSLGATPSADAQVLQAVKQESFQGLNVHAVHAPPVVCLEIWGEQIPESRIGPVSLAGKPLLVGSRHQPYLLELEKSLTNLVDRDHFCIASEGGVFWLLCLTSKGLWRVREGTEPQRLILDDLASLQHGDLIVPRLGAEVTVEQCCRTLSWTFLVVLEPS